MKKNAKGGGIEAGMRNMAISRNVYRDNVLNRRLGRVGLPLGRVSQEASVFMVSVTEDTSRVYIKNNCNKILKRVGKRLDSRAVGFGRSVDSLVRRLRANPGHDFDEVDSDVAEAAADIYTREVVEYEWKAAHGYSTDAPLKTNLRSILTSIPEEKIIPSSEVKLFKRIGGGGFGDVFLGTLHGDVVAVKKIRHAKEAEWLTSFGKEMKILSKLDHPNIVRFICASVETRNPLIVMEYAEMSLFEALHVRQIQMPDKIKVDVMTQMWRGLSYLHKHKVAHCDVKSGNVLLQNVKQNMKANDSGTDIIAKLSDFGLTILVEDDDDPEKLRRPEAFSIRYAAPEILRREKQDLDGLKAADVYSMATVVFELATEAEPFNDIHSYEQLIQERMDGTRNPLHSATGFVQDYFHTLMRPCWAIDPKERPTASFVLMAIEKMIRNGTMAEAFTSYRKKKASYLSATEGGNSRDDCSSDEDREEHMAPYYLTFSYQFLPNVKGRCVPTSFKGAYTDTAINRLLDREGLPLRKASDFSWYSPAFMKHSYTSLYSNSKDRPYVDNHCNRVLGRVGQPVTVNQANGLGRSVLEMVQKLETEGHKDLAGTNEKVALAAAGIYVRQCFVHFLRTVRDSEQFIQPPTMPTPGHKIVSNFGDIRFRRQLGSGSFGDTFTAVFRCEVVAAKMLTDEAFKKPSLQGFSTQIQLLCRLDHPNIVHYICGSVAFVNRCLLMEYSEMSLLEAVHVRQMQMNDETKLDVMMQLWLGAWYLHSRNVVHADIKSNNVFLDQVGDFESGRAKGLVAKLGDFGLVMMQNQSDFQSSVKVFAVKAAAARYAAPEIIKKQRFTLEELKMADVYSLATVCHEIITEREPFARVTPDDKVLRMRREMPFVRPSQYVEGFPAFDFIEKCWDVQAGQRPEAQDMVTVLYDKLKRKTYLDR